MYKMMIGFAALCLVGCGLIEREGSDAGVSVAPEPSQATTAATAIAVTEPSMAEVMAKATTLYEAVAAAKPKMVGNKKNEHPDGSEWLAVWAAGKGLTWQDVARKDETTFAKVMKDVDEEVGKAYCVSGSIIQISVEKIGDDKIAQGVLMDGSVNYFYFSAIGSSGNLVARHSARLCGVVTGRFSYSNSGGGTTHAVEIVGMFDLPENKKK